MLSSIARYTLSSPAQRLSDRIFLGPLDQGPRLEAFEDQVAEFLKRNDGRTDIPLERYLLHVPQGVKLSEPLSIAVSSLHSCLLVVAEEHAAVTIAETLSGGAKDSLWFHGVDIAVGSHAAVTFLSLQSAAEAASVRLEQRSTVATGGFMHWQNVTLGGSEVQHDLRSEVRGCDARSSIDWVFAARGKERQTLSAHNAFQGQRGGGEITMKGVAEEQAHISAHGMIEIGPSGSGTESYLTQHVLMLDPSAKVDAVPGLAIKTNEVKASHSATVSRVSDEDLFYFAARGISREDAREMYVLGFLGDVLRRIPSPALHVRIHRALRSKLAHSSASSAS